MKRAILLLVIFVVLLAAPSAYRYLRYYDLGGAASRGAIPVYNPADAVQPVPTPATSSFADVPETVGDDILRGRVLLDMAHENAFTETEMGHFLGRLSARGYAVVPHTGGNLAAALRAVNAYVVMAPLRPFTTAEILAVKAFVANGGRLLLIGDPTRYNVVIEETFFDFTVIIEDSKIPLNSLASAFDLNFNGDYLYNLTENEGNFRNIIMRGSSLAAENELTADVQQMVFYGAHSLDVGPSATAVLTGDDNTWSSATDRPGGLTLAATNENGRVLALTDLHFMMEPYFTAYDNSRFLAHIADWLTTQTERTTSLTDFPYFYRQPINLVYTGQPDLGAQAFNQVIALQEAFRAIGQEIRMTAVPDPSQDTLTLGLYNQAGDDVLEILASNGISFTIEPPILTAAEEKALAATATPTPTPDDEEEETTEEEEATEEPEKPEEPAPIRLIHTPLGNVQMSGTAIVLLENGNGRHQVIVLAASKEGLDNTVDLLLDLIPLNASYESAGCLVQGNLALCPTGVANEEVEAELLTGGQPGVEEPEEPQEPEEPEEPGEPAPDIDAVNQGTIELDETVEGTLAENESHAWTFKGGPAFVDIVVQGDDDLDAVLELYDPNNELVTSVDSTFSGEAEEILGIEIEDDGDYTIVVRDYFDSGGGYSLTVTLSEDQTSEGGGGPIENIFLFVDDDGEPLGEGITSADLLLALLGDSYEVTVWVASVDGLLPDDALDDADLLIWDSGDYRNENGFFDDDTITIFNYLDSGGMLFLTGSSPTILADAELATLVDLEITGDDPVLLDGLNSGDVIELDGSYQAVLSDLLAADAEEDSTPFLLRGPASGGSGEVAGIAVIDDFTSQRVVLVLLPLVLLPETIQETLLTNIMAWFTSGGGG
ncbi:MAG TPA: hypothetical protein PLD25_14650 [Chloroflexota bacterium]|nr:hypothetical protein [Chloroflexota bacterium]HUM69621.1 hypothetical protein [Chloroflexota bacterium]